ncbi:hypothetical protein FACS1894176_09730 [Bacteroidia bacterium]|nr:hypothetical protein FACS1894176_09730 [Bacteroidia bacterium]
MRLKAYDKSINKYMNNIRRDTKEEIRALENYLNEHKEEQFFISDSESVGNCIPGTEAFMEKYGIKEGIT